MHDGSQLEPKEKNFAGYRPLAPVDFTKGMSASAYGLVAGATGLGLMLGVAAAFTMGHGRVSAAPQVSAALTPRTSGLSMLPASYISSAPTLLSQVEPQKKPVATVVQVSVHPGKKHAKAHKRHGMRKLLDWKKNAREHKGAKRPEYVSPNQPPEPVGPTALQMATTAAAAGPFFLGIQGDATVANYDPATGTIQTYEGETYLLAKAGNEGNAIPWQDYPFNVHYRCDELGSCTLSHAGGSAVAKLTR